MSLSIQSLVGGLKAATDIKVRKTRTRYQQSTSVGSGQYMRMTLPRTGNQMLDCRDVAMKFDLAITSTDSANIKVKGDNVATVFSRVRVSTGSTVLYDLSHSDLLLEVQSKMAQRAETTSSFGSMRKGIVVDATIRNSNAQNATTYICNPFAQGSLLNSSSLLPLDSISPIHLDFWTAVPGNFLYSPSDANADYTIANIECLYTTIESPTVRNYVQQSGLRFHVSDWSHRYNNIPAATECNLIVPSSHTALRSLLTVIRPTATIGDVTSLAEYQSYNSGSNLSAMNCYVDNATRLLYQQDITSKEHQFLELESAFPEITDSTFYGSDYKTTKHILGVRFSSAPPSFDDNLLSNFSTTHAGDVSLKLTFGSTPSNIRADSFLVSDVEISLVPGGRDLTVRY